MVTENEMVRWHLWLNGNEFEQTWGDSEGQRNTFKNLIYLYCPIEKWNAKAIVKGCRETGKELLSDSMANGTAYLSHISDLPSKVFWVQGEQPQTSFLLHDVLHWLDSHQISEALQLCVCVCVCV